MSQRINATFGGVPCSSVEFSMGLGITPGSGTIVFPYPNPVVPQKGTLILTDGTETVILNNIYADRPRKIFNAEAGLEVAVTIYDRRFIWKWGAITKRANIVGVAGVPVAEVTLRVLMQECLAALGETNSVLRGIPTEYPEVNWEFENPANALEDLCERYGLVIGMASTSNNPIIICPYDSPGSLPSEPAEEELLGIQQNILPQNIILVGGRYVCQATFTSLVAVGEETDGTIKPITSLSYAPADWGDELANGLENIADVEERELAEKCVFKWYSIDWANCSWTPEQVLPLLTDIADVVTVEGETKHERAYVEATKVKYEAGNFSTIAKGKISEGFTFDRKLGIVKFNALMVVPASTGFYTTGFNAATVDLTAAFESKFGNSDDFPWFFRVVPNGTVSAAIHKETSLVGYKKLISGSWVIQNLTELTNYALRQLDKLIHMYQVTYPQVGIYPGIFSFGAWGIIKNVIWSLSAETGASTEIQKGMEIPRPQIPDYKEKLMKRRFSALWQVTKDLDKLKRLYPYD